MEIQLQLYSILRDKLPREARGRTVLDMSDGARLEDILTELDIRRNVVVAVNGEHEKDMSRRLADGDEVKIFSSVGGG